MKADDFSAGRVKILNVPCNAVTKQKIPSDKRQLLHRIYSHYAEIRSTDESVRIRTPSCVVRIRKMLQLSAVCTQVSCANFINLCK